MNQSAKGDMSSFDALINWLESIENFIASSAVLVYIQIKLLHPQWLR